MKQFHSTTLKSLIILAALVTVNFSYGKTYTAINSGKWSDATIWQDGAPGNTISADDQVIIKNHVVITSDIAISGTMTIEKGKTVISNKTLLISNEGKLINDGSITAKRIVNEGTINNNSSMESMNEIENKGTVNNNSNIIAGTNILNFGGNVTGTRGTYFANSSVITSTDAKFGSNIKIYSNPSETSSNNESGTSLDVNSENGSAVVTVNSTKDLTIK